MFVCFLFFFFFFFFFSILCHFASADKKMTKYFFFSEMTKTNVGRSVNQEIKKILPYIHNFQVIIIN